LKSGIVISTHGAVCTNKMQTLRVPQYLVVA